MNQISSGFQHPVTFPNDTFCRPISETIVRHNTSKSQAGAVLGSSRSAAKKEAAQENGKAGGRPKGS